MSPETEPLGSAIEHDGLRIPRHLGVTMDGNGRWATDRGRPRTDGHREGIKALRRLVEYCGRYGTQYLTVFSFSSENWSRPAGEVKFIFRLLRQFVDSDLNALIRNNVRVRIIGERRRLEASLVTLIDKVERKTAHNTGLNLQVAFNYGGRAEIALAAKALAHQVKSGTLNPESIDEEMLGSALLTAGIPDPDVILRTSGELRFSNFLIWQAAYSELIFVEERWPDFDEEVFVRMLREYAGRERRFGGIEVQGG